MGKIYLLENAFFRVENENFLNGKNKKSNLFNYFPKIGSLKLFQLLLILFLHPYFMENETFGTFLSPRYAQE